jgi:hypothetical protein
VAKGLSGTKKKSETLYLELSATGVVSETRQCPSVLIRTAEKAFESAEPILCQVKAEERTGLPLIITTQSYTDTLALWRGKGRHSVDLHGFLPPASERDSRLALPVGL